MVAQGTIKLAVTLGEPSRMATVMIDFLAVNCPSAFNGVLGRPLLRALKVVTSIDYLTMKFPAAVGTGQVQGRQCIQGVYSRSLELAKMDQNYPRLWR